METEDGTLQAIFDQATVGVAQIALDGSWLRVNPRYCQMLGYSESELRMKTIWDITHPDDCDEVLAARRQLLEGTISSHSMEKRYIRRDGTIFWGRLNRSLVRNNDDLPKFIIAVLEDITEKVRVERALRDREEQLVLAQSAARLGVWNTDLQTGVTVTSGHYAQLRGLPPGDRRITHEEWLATIHPDDRERIQADLQDCIERTHIWDKEFRVVWPDGSVHWLLGKGQVFFDDAGRPVRLSGATIDITERKRVDEALRESEERFRRVFEEGPIGLALVGRDYQFVKINRALCQMVGYSEEVLLQMSFLELTHPDDLRVDLGFAERLFRREIPFFKLQKRYVKKDGEIIWVNLTASVIHDQDGEPRYGLAMIEDITEIKRGQDEALARQKLESVGTLANGIAHDFNNLLGGVLAQAELALSEVAAGVNPEEELRAIRDVAMRGSEIVRELMIYAGKENPVVGLVDVSRIVKDILELLKVSVSKHAVLEMDLGQGLPAVRASAAQLRQIVLNLVTNASDAIGDRDGVIRVTTNCVKAGQGPPGEISARQNDCHYMELEVSDTGRGIPLEIQAKVFDPFFSTKSAGHGLGLAVVQGIVRSLGGSIHFTSEPGKGTRFQILLPCAETTAEPTRDAITGIEELPTPSQDATILVVEDEGTLRQAVTKLLRKTGFDVLEAADGTSAIDLLRANGSKVDAILLDMTLPGASGAEVVAEAAKAQPGIKVVLTSAYSQEKLKPAMNALPVCGFIRKPFRLGDLVKTLRKSLLP
jgi:PAS domain S-box-containing protein